MRLSAVASQAELRCRFTSRTKDGARVPSSPLHLLSMLAFEGLPMRSCALRNAYLNPPHPATASRLRQPGLKHLAQNLKHVPEGLDVKPPTVIAARV
eukprot:scaffold26718_cov52-Phaeocystis_antarctica.AAC.4